MTKQADMLETLQRFLADRHDDNFTRAVKVFLGGSDEERFRAFMFTLTSAKTLANVILDGGKFTISNGVLMQSVTIQLVKLLEEQRTREKGSN